MGSKRVLELDVIDVDAVKVAKPLACPYATKVLLEINNKHVTNSQKHISILPFNTTILYTVFLSMFEDDPLMEYFTRDMHASAAGQHQSPAPEHAAQNVVFKMCHTRT